LYPEKILLLWGGQMGIQIYREFSIGRKRGGDWIGRVASSLPGKNRRS